MKNNIDEHFAKQGINLIYNTLGHTDELVSTYIKESYDLFILSGADQSNAIKGSVYNKFYSLKPRIKKTGFEKLSVIDTNFRSVKVPTTLRDRFLYPNVNFSVEKNDDKKYFEVLKTSLVNIKNPLLFYSGGIDSELVLQAFICAGKIPDVVVFEFLDKHGSIINDYDLQHAYAYCDENNIKPIIRQIVPELLWEETEFINFGREMKIGSPQILTHLWMAKIMAKEMPNHTNCFGGEVRYSNYDKDHIGKTVIVNSVKTDPLLATSYTLEFDYANNALLVLETFRPGYYGGYPSLDPNATAWEVYAISANGAPTLTEDPPGANFLGTYSDQLITSGGGGTFEFKFTWSFSVNDTGQSDATITYGDAKAAGQDTYYSPTGSNSGTFTQNLGIFLDNSMTSAPGIEATMTLNWTIKESGNTAGPYTTTLTTLTK